MITIRPYHSRDFEMLTKWWRAADEAPPPSDCIPEETTFVLEVNEVPILSLSLILTNAKGFCYGENFVGNPEYKGSARRELAQTLVAHIEELAKSRGYKRILGFAYHDSLKQRYTELGYHQTLDNVGTFIKVLE